MSSIQSEPTERVDPVGIHFSMERDSSGSLTGTVSWTSGFVEYLDSDGDHARAEVQAGRQRCGASWLNEGALTVWWDRRNPHQLGSHPGDVTDAVRANPDCTLAVSSADPSGLIVHWGHRSQ